MTLYLDTERLLLRQFKEDDAERLFDLDSDPEVMRYVGPFQLADVAAYRMDIVNRHFEYYRQRKGLGFWAAISKRSDEFLGWFVLRPARDYRFADEADFEDDDVEIGFRLRRASWGYGFATEVSRALIRRALDELRVKRVVACALATNISSRRVLEKSGLRQFGQFRLPMFDDPILKYRSETAPCLPR